MAQHTETEDLDLWEDYLKNWNGKVPDKEEDSDQRSGPKPTIGKHGRKKYNASRS